MTIKVFLGANDSFNVANNNVNVVGSSGSEKVIVGSGVTGTTTDANIEALHLVGNLATYSFVFVAGTGLQVMSGATVVATIPSINAASIAVAFADGTANLVQTGGSTYTLGGSAVSTTLATPSTYTTAGLGANFNTALKTEAVGGGSASTFALVAGAASVNEASTATFALSGGTANTTYTYNIGGIAAADTLNGSLTGTVTTNASGAATIGIDLKADRLTEGTETMTVSLPNSSLTASTTVTDTSLNNVAPTATAASVTVAKAGAAVTGQLVGSDADGDAITFALTAPVEGVAITAAGAYTFTPASNTAAQALAYSAANLVIPVAYTVTDALGAVTSSTLSITVTPTPISYTLSAAAASVTEGTSVVYTVTASENVTSATPVVFTLAPGNGTGPNAGTNATNTLDFVSGSFNPSTNTTIAAGTKTATFTVSPSGSDVTELPETFTVQATVGGTATLLSPLTGTVLDDGIQNFVLTTSQDTFAGGVGNDTFTGSITKALSGFDNLKGGAGNDALTVTETAALDTTALSLTVESMESATFNTLAGIVANTTGWGTTALTVTNAVGGAVVLTAEATTAVTATNNYSNAAGDITVTGGLSQTITSSGGGADVTLSGAVGAINVTETARGAGTITVNGGTSVNVTATSSSTGTTSIGGTTAPTGAITVSNTTTGNGVTAGAINVKGGATVAITQAHTNAVNTTNVNAAVTVIGTANTTAVTVTNAAAATASATVAGVTANTVSITDVNSGSTTLAGTITSATISNFTSASIADNALTTLNLTGGSGNIIIDNSGLTTATNKTLGLTLNGQTGGTLDDADIYTTLNVNTTGAASTLANITFGGATALTVAGTKGLTLTSTAGLTALQTVTVTGSAGITANLSAATVTAVDTSGTTGSSTVTVDATKATFTGGAGVDKVTTSAVAPTKAISLGDGDDFLTLAGGTTTVTGTITGGNGTDTLSMAAADAATASGSATFATKVSGFERLILTGATNQTVDLAVLGNYNHVTTSGGNGLSLNAMPSGGTLVLTGAGTAYTVGVTNAAIGSADVLNVSLTDGSTAGVAFASTGITATAVESIAITVADTQTTPSGTFNDSLTLLGNSATSITISGNAGLTLTATDTAATTVDASGITLGGFTWTSGALAAANTVKGSVSGTNTVDLTASVAAATTYTGGTGIDNLTITNAKNNVINLGGGTTTNSVAGSASGNNTVTSTSTAADTVTLGAGNNTVSLGNGANVFTATSGNNTFTGGTGVDTVTVGGGVNSLTLGTGADSVSITAPSASVNVYTTITDPHAGVSIALANQGTETFASTKVTLANTAVFQDYANAVIQAGGNASVNAALGWFQIGGDTYLVESRHDGSANNASFVNGTDMVIKLTGLVDLSTATGAGTHILTLV